MVLKQWKKANLNDQAEAAWQKWKQKYYTEETFTESYFKSHKSVIHSRLLQTFPCSTISLFYTISAIRYNAEFHQTQNTECRRRTSSINQSRFIHLECSINHKIAHVLSADDQVSALDMSLWKFQFSLQSTSKSIDSLFCRRLSKKDQKAKTNSRKFAILAAKLVYCTFSNFPNFYSHFPVQFKKRMIW